MDAAPPVVTVTEVADAKGSVGLADVEAGVTELAAALEVLGSDPGEEALTV